MEDQSQIDGSMSQLASELQINETPAQQQNQPQQVGVAVPQSSRSSIYETTPKKGGNLFFQFGGQDDDMEQLIELQRGKEYEATYVVSESSGKFREVIMNINLMGIKVYEPKNKKRRREFDIEAILQYSYNRSSQKFTFAYLEADGVLTNYRFISKEFFEIHQTLGSAIAMMVKVKNNEIQLPQVPEESQKSDESRPMSQEISSPAMDRASLKSDKSTPQLKPNSMELERSNSNAGNLESKEGEENPKDLKLQDQPHQEKQSIQPPEQQTTESPESSLNENRRLSGNFTDVSATTSIVVHSGGDDDAISIMTNDDRASVAESAEVTDSIFDSGEKDIGVKPAKPSKKDKGNFTKTLRAGWTLFGNTRTGAALTSKKTGKSTQELSSIQEGGAHNPYIGSHDSLQFNRPEPNPKATFHSSRLGTLAFSDRDRRKSVQELFSGGSTPTSPTVDETDEKKKTLSQNPSVMAAGETSANSIDSMSTRENRELPPVDMKHDAFGREILIKNLKGGKYDITAGTIEQLVESLAEEAPPDTIYIEVFLLTFRHFMTPVQLMKLLQARFLYQSEDGRPNQIIKLRVVSVLKKWAERHYYDFRFVEMQEALAAFMNDINSSDCAKYGSQIKSILDAEMERSKTFTEIKTPVAPPEIQKVINNIDFVTMWSPKRIAQELTLQDLKLFRTIKPDEFCLFLWGEKNDPRIANFNAYIDRFNKIGFWVSTVIVGQKDIKRRVDAIEKFIQVLKYCQKYANYSSTMAILSGLNTTAVSRLKKTWEIVQKGRQISTYKDVEAKMSYRGNFKTYREIESQAKQPFIPFFGLYVKDLTFMNDGNQKHLVLQTSKDAQQVAKTEGSEQAAMPPPPQLINFEKCRGITDKIHAIRVFQQSTYKFEEEKDDKEGFFSQFSTQSTASDSDLSIYLGHPFGPPAIDDEKRLLDMSRECEPSERQNTNNNNNNYVATTAVGTKDAQQQAQPLKIPSPTTSSNGATTVTAAAV